MAQLLSVRLNKEDASSLGFRLQGGIDFGTPLIVQKVNIGSPAEKAGLIVGDSVIKINSTDVYNLRHKDAQDAIIRAGPSFEITVQRGGSSTWKPSVTPLPKPVTSSSFAPVTKTSLAAKPQPPIDSIGTGHNLAAKPFNPQVNGAVNGAPKLVNKQYNTPVGLYSEESIAETLSAQTEVLSTGVLGVNFKKNEKNYDASNSAVFRMVQEADKEPRALEPEQDSGILTSPLGVGGLRHVQAPETKPATTSPSIPPGQNICAECERLIVGVFVRIKDKNLHVECFKCATCGASLKNAGYYNINQKLYCDIHAKLAARSATSTPNSVPTTILPVAKAPAGTISSALAAHSFPSAAPLSPSTGSPNITAQPFQSGSFTGSPRPFSSVNAPLSPTVNNFSTLPRTSPIAPSPISQEKTRQVHNIIWPPPPSFEEANLPTATPLYLPPPPHRTTSKTFVTNKRGKESSVNPDTYISSKTSDQNTSMERKEVEKMQSLIKNINTTTAYSSEIVTTTESKLLIEEKNEGIDSKTVHKSGFEQISDSAASLDENIVPKVEVKTTPLCKAADTSRTTITDSNAPRVVTSVCVCTNPNCNAHNGKLCAQCPMRNAKTLEPIEDCIAKRIGSPIITGVSVTINNPGKIKGNENDLFTQIPEKKSTSALAYALAVTPTEPFTPVDMSCPSKHIPLPEETKPYFPPDRPPMQVQTSSKIQKIKSDESESGTVFALRINTNQPTAVPKAPSAAVPKTPPTAGPKTPPTAVSKTPPTPKGRKEKDTLIDDLPRPKQWMSMIDALTTASDRAFSPFFAEPINTGQVEICEKYEKEINTTTGMQQQVEQKSVHGKAHSTTMLKEVYIPNRTSTCAKKVSSEKKQQLEQTISELSYISSVDSHELNTQLKKNEGEHESHNKVCSNKQEKKQYIDKQTEETILKKPLDLAGCLQKREYIPQYQMSLNYDEALQLPHHKDIKKLLPNEPRNQISKDTSHSVASTHERHTHSQQAYMSQSLSLSNKKSIISETHSAANIKENVPQVVFQPIADNATPTYSSRPSSSTSSAHVIPYYQEQLVSTQMLAPKINVYDPKSPATSRSPSPCMERAPSPFKALSPRPISPAAGPPPNPLKKGEPVIKFNKDFYQMESAKKSISHYIPQYRDKLDVSPIRSGSERCVTDTCSSSQNFETIAKSTLERAHLHDTTQAQQEEQRNEKTQTSLCSRDTAAQAIIASAISRKNSVPKNQLPALNSNQINMSRAVSESKRVLSVGASVPTVSQTNTGPSGGRQPGAIGISPKRGRGILNVGGLIGSRIPLCGHCHSQVRGPFITALGKIWCPEHFTCSTPSCRRPLQDLGFVEEQAQLYCEYCFEQYIAPPCNKCAAKIKGDCLRAIGKNYHPECFSCSYCGKLFANSPFFLEDGQPYCENDWNELFTTKCFACGFPVEAGDRWVEALNNNYHSQCFNCTMCKKNLEGQSFFAKGGRPFCKNHAR